MPACHASTVGFQQIDLEAISPAPGSFELFQGQYSLKPSPFWGKTYPWIEIDQVTVLGFEPLIMKL